MKRILFSILCVLALAGLGAVNAHAADMAAGKVIFDTNCQSYHGATGKGDGPVGAALNPKPRDLSVGEFKFDTDGDGKPGTDADIKNIIQKGAGAYGGSMLMAPWPTLSDTDIENVTVYIRSLKQ